MNSYKRWKFNAMEGRESQLKRRGHINKERERETGSKVMITFRGIEEYIACCYRKKSELDRE